MEQCVLPWHRPRKTCSVSLKSWKTIVVLLQLLLDFRPTVTRAQKTFTLGECSYWVVIIFIGSIQGGAVRKTLEYKMPRTFGEKKYESKRPACDLCPYMVVSVCRTCLRARWTILWMLTTTMFTPHSWWTTCETLWRIILYFHHTFFLLQACN